MIGSFKESMGFKFYIEIEELFALKLDWELEQDKELLEAFDCLSDLNNIC